MSRKLLAILLSELHTVRITCVNSVCGAVTEVSLEVLGRMHDPKCHHCNHSYGMPTEQKVNTSTIAVLANAIQKIHHAANGGTYPVAPIEFVMLDPEAK